MPLYQDHHLPIGSRTCHADRDSYISCQSLRTFEIPDRTMLQRKGADTAEKIGDTDH